MNQSGIEIWDFDELKGKRSLKNFVWRIIFPSKHFDRVARRVDFEIWITQNQSGTMNSSILKIKQIHLYFAIEFLNVAIILNNSEYKHKTWRAFKRYQYLFIIRSQWWNMKIFEVYNCFSDYYAQKDFEYKIYFWICSQTPIQLLSNHFYRNLINYPIDFCYIIKKQRKNKVYKNRFRQSKATIGSRSQKIIWLGTKKGWSLLKREALFW
jgi:hypothetical protein